MGKKIGGYFLMGTGFLACPCHLVLTLPLALGLLGGTAVGGFLAQNSALVFGLSAAYFIGALALGLRMLQRHRHTSGEECAACSPDRRDVLESKV